jgi:tellurite resistance protein
VAYSTTALASLGIALREAGTKIHRAVHELRRGDEEAASWMQRFIYREIEQRARTRGTEYWDQIFPGLTPAERAQRRIGRMLTRCTVAGVAAAAGASSAELLSLVTEGAGVALAIPLGVASVGAEMVYTTALQIDLAFDLAAIYQVPFARDDVGEISTLLGLALGVDLVCEPSGHDSSGQRENTPRSGSFADASSGATKPWRVMRQMQREDFATQVGRQVVQQSVLRNVVPIAGIVVSAAWNQVMLRRFAAQVHTAVRQRLGIVRACGGMHLGEQRTARFILDGAWLIATADGDLGHHEALALATLIDSLSLPARISVHESSFCDDEEAWFERLLEVEPAHQASLIDVLALVASADGVFSTPERRFLRRVGRSWGRPIDLERIERVVAAVRRGDPPRRLTELSWEPASAAAPV